MPGPQVMVRVRADMQHTIIVQGPERRDLLRKITPAVPTRSDPFRAGVGVAVPPTSPPRRFHRA